MKIPTGYDNRTIPGNMAKFVTFAFTMVAKFTINASGTIWWSKLELMQVSVAKFATNNKVTPVTDSIAWVRCASDNV